MIGKPEWFTRRKYGGWGLYPATWQGWVYIAVCVAVIFIIQNLPIGEQMVVVSTVVLGIIMFVDVIHMMISMKKDERESQHEAYAERNALWVMILVLTAGIAYESAQSIALGQTLTVDPVIIIALALGLIAKAVSNYYLDKKN